ncbi:branched-chain amino acid ABC transporter ATP-binding protein/permease [Neobacillus rhizophilus]|uniref:Branched-chain amino acid ABC transporter ATP-binding protein/permease n=1 Tax=Neobacillus rhizophilus TaxID=2833579 RepID=A0A942YWD5_9BACI|nr:branched-chain amino acid ABC transporter ATP-binding protein/permease [Neobacillus rhizophilus]MBS4214979.1 branched-chain amino acid ABC transporter ATP-binding protein/permease [Neobacillus rhizophilus]
MPNSLIKANSMQKKYSRIFKMVCAAALLISFVLPLFAGDYYMRLISLIFIYIILAVGYNISAGFSGITSFAFAAHYGVGAYVSAVAITRYNMPFLVGLLAGALASGLVGLVVSLPASKVKHHYLALISIGLLEIVQQILNEWQWFTGGSGGMYIPSWDIFSISLNNFQKYYVIFIIMLFCVVLQRNLMKSRWGRDLIAIKNNEIAAAGVGINYSKYRIAGYFLSSILAGLAGSVYASFSGYLSPDTFNFEFTVFILLMAVVGGEGTLSGPIIGAVFVTFIPMLFNAAPDLKQIVFGALLVILPQVMPAGIAGTIKKYFKEIDNNNYIVEKTEGNEFDIERNVIKNNSEIEDILVVKGLTKRFGGVTAVDGLDMTIKRGTVHSLIGPNGAGKSTTVNMITGIDKPSEGSITFNGKEITGDKFFNLTKKGLSRTYQHVRLFNNLSVVENVAIGGRLFYSYSIIDSIFRTRKMKKEERKSFHEAMEYLKIINLNDKANYDPESLSAGQQKLLELARALYMKPDLLVLDEPCAGLSETETMEFAKIIHKIRNAGISILMIEHHMDLVMEISDYITVIDYGKKIAEGDPASVNTNPVVKTAYLGEGA